MTILFALLFVPGASEPEIGVAAFPTVAECREAGDELQGALALEGLAVKYTCIPLEAME